MSRLFLRVYIGIAVVLVIGTVGTLYILSRGLEAARQRSFEERMIDSAEFIKSRIQADNLFEEQEELWRLSRAARLSFSIRDQSEVDPRIVARLTEDGETFVERDETGRHRVYGLFLDGQVFVGRFGRDRRNRDNFRPDRPDRWDRGGPPGPPNRFGPPDRRRGPDGPPGPDLVPEDWMRTRNLFLMSVIGIPILLVGPAIYFLIRPLDRRIHALSRVAERFGEGDLDSRGETLQTDAFGELTGAFNAMADRIKGLIEGQNDLLRAVSHELRTPLARLFFMVDDAESATSEAEKQRHLDRIQKTLTEMNDLVEELTTFIRLDRDQARDEIERLPVAPPVEDVRESVGELRADVGVVVECDENLQVNAVPRLFKRAVMNLATNAVRHAETHVRIRITAAGDGCIVAVDDDGPGVPIEHRQRILQPFLRVDESRTSSIGGVGLGLAIVDRIMTLHNGQVEITDSDLGGASFRLQFP